MLFMFILSNGQNSLFLKKLSVTNYCFEYLNLIFISKPETLKGYSGQSYKMLC